MGVGVTTATATGEEQIVTPGAGLDPPQQRESPSLMQAQQGEGSLLCPPAWQSLEAAVGQG